MSFLSAIERVLTTAWVGGLWAIGYIAAPTLFAVLDERKLAGQLAGEMFHIINWLGLICGALLLLIVLKRYGRVWQLWVVLVMLVFVANNEFVLQPMMAELKIQGLVDGSAAKSRFGILHGLSSAAYMLISILGLALVGLGFNKPKAQLFR
ncbi:MAG: DUF4149 domain-containing protein [Gammaproteobacteria bacterium]|jgi:hypothetical protein|nr:DUF4149 domain-containing protein [Gammaproteobacteria bacterium]